MTTMTGGCLCGAVRYEVKPTLLFSSFACHCGDCRRRTGSAFGLQQPVLESDLTLTGAVIEGRHVQPSGAVATIVACPTCLSRLYTTNDRRPGMVTLRVGTLDDGKERTPDFHLWTDDKQAWVTIPDDVPALPEQPETIEEWTRLLRPRRPA